MLPPGEDEPDDDGGEEHGDGVDLGFHGVEPETVAEGVGQGADHAGDDGDQVIVAVLFAAAHDAHQLHDHQVEEHHRQGAADHRDEIDPETDIAQRQQ